MSIFPNQKVDLKKVTGVDTSDFAEIFDWANSKSDLDKIVNLIINN